MNIKKESNKSQIENKKSLNHFSLLYSLISLVVSFFSAKIESSDRKRKKEASSISSVDRKNKDRASLSKTKKTKMSSSGNQVRASHILIKHQGSRRKASWKDPDGRVISNTTRESALSQLKEIGDDIILGKITFEDAASRFSDCSSAKRGGDLGMNLFYFVLYCCLAELRSIVDFFFFSNLILVHLKP